jgi:hypothetical protein
MIAARAATLLPTLGAFTRAYDQVSQGEIPWGSAPIHGREATYELVATARMWFPLVVRDMAGVDRSNFLDSVIGDDLTNDVERLMALLRDGRGADGEHLPYRDHAIEQLDITLRDAQSKWYEAEALDIGFAERMQDLRGKAVSFRAELEWFAQSVAYVLGHNEPDYLRLLPSRAWHLDNADDRQAPNPEIVEPATLVTGVPRILEA